MNTRYLLNNIETDRISFRKIREDDFELWLPFFEDPITSRYWIAELESPQRECTKWYEKQFHRYENNLGGMNVLLEKETGNLIGHCGLLVQQVDDAPELEIGYSLLPEYWNKGYATEAAITCKNHAFENNLSDSIISIISITNKPSENVARKNGMTVDKQTVYRGNPVNIFRIHRSAWLSH